ncbi:MAG: FecR domain-containing protein [Desulfobacula sp.]|jgi:hypothetical protein
MKPHHKIFIRQVVIIVLFLFTSSTGFADPNDSIGKVVAIRGKISALNANFVKRELSINAPVFLNDTIKTEQGRIQLMFNDSTLITLGSNTEMKLTKYSWKPEDKNSTMETRIEEGSFRIMGGAITRTAPENFKTHTPSGTIGIRGSMYAGIVKGAMLSIIFQGGRGIYIKNDIGLVNINKPGFGTTIKSASQAPEEPKKMTQEELMIFETALASNTENNKSDPSSGAPPSEPSGSQSESNGTPTDEKTGSQSIQDTGDQTGQTESSATGNLTISETLVSDPTPEKEPLIPFFTNEISDVIETVLTSAQTTLNTNLTPTGTEQEIKSILLDLGYTGTFGQSSFTPSTGIWIYTGKMKNMLSSETPEDIKFIVNWDNGRIIGLENISTTSTHINTGFGFGNIDATGTISGINVLGSDNSNGTGIVRAMTGNETFGHFYGSDQSGLGLEMGGYDINLQNQSDQIPWKDISAALVSNKAANTYSGTENWKGFVIGIAEDMASPYNNRRVFRNVSINDYTLAIDKDNGTFTGSLTGYDFLNVSNSIIGLSIGGGTSDSVYISDKTLGASFSSGSSNVSISGNLGGVKTYGNFMVTSDTSSLSTYTTWGYWEIAYSEPGTGKDYHVHIPGSLWIAGNPTPGATITSLIGANFTGTYSGKAEGVMFDNSTQMTRMTNGATNLMINFAPGASFPVSGNLTFTEVTLPVTSSTDISPSGFIGTISGASSSSVNGSFFGPAAEAAGGNFSAAMPDGKQYHGIFAGNR